jgi:hypothetical protein
VRILDLTKEERAFVLKEIKIRKLFTDKWDVEARIWRN